MLESLAPIAVPCSLFIRHMTAPIGQNEHESAALQEKAVPGSTRDMFKP